ncbi:MAG: EAL domain-containing protein, partial [Campylobacteraceae bacterium]|nr:EAL domain-containing protein [Campylobacteraceae bacterium]
YGKDLSNKIIIDLVKILENKINDIGILYKLRNNEFGILLNKEVDNNFCEELVSFVDNYDFRYEDIKVKINITLAIAYTIDKLIIEKTSATVRVAVAQGKSFKVYKESFYDDDQFSKHIEWTKNLEDALDNNKIIPFFQAIKDVNTSKIDKYEVLARLEKDDVIYTPDKFLNVARKSRQYSRFTIMMIKNSFEFFSKKEGISFSINFSIEDMVDDNVTKYLIEQIEKYNIGNRFIIEILETEEIEDFNIVNDFVKKLKKYDVKVAIDDFGSGYSNFTYISKLNIDFLKIDGSLVEDIHTNKSSYKVVKNLNSFAHDMGLKTIAEKVHCKEIEDLLYELKVDYVQGYHIGKPQKNLIE